MKGLGFFSKSKGNSNISKIGLTCPVKAEHGHTFYTVGLLVVSVLIPGNSRSPDLILQKMGLTVRPNLKVVRAKKEGKK
jgi:hypothetical protein